MGTKRKVETAAAVPDSIEMKIKEGNGPFVVSMPCGFKPENAPADCAWETYAHGKRRNTYAVVAKTVRIRIICPDHLQKRA